MEVVDKGIILADIGAVSLVLKGVEEESKAAANHQLWIDLIGEAHTRRKVVLLRLDQPLAPFVCLHQRDVILGQRVVKAGRQGSHILAGGRNNVLRRVVGRAIRHKVGLSAIGFVDRPEVIPAQTEIESQFGRHLPIVLEVRRQVGLCIVGLVDVGGVDAVGAAGIVDTIRDGRRRWRQQELRNARRAGVVVHNIGVLAVIVEVAARPRRLQGRELYVLIFQAHLEAVLAVNLRKVVGNLQGLADLVRRQEVVAAQGGKSAKSELRQAAVFVALLHTLFIDPELFRDVCNSALRPVTGGVQVGKAAARHVDRAGREDVGIGRNHL